MNAQQIAATVFSFDANAPQLIPGGHDLDICVKMPEAATVLERLIQECVDDHLEDAAKIIDVFRVPEGCEQAPAFKQLAKLVRKLKSKP